MSVSNGIAMAMLVLASHAAEAQPQVRAADVIFSGFDVLGVERLDAIRRAAPLQVGAAITKADLQETARLAVTALLNAGYANARVDVFETEIAPDRERVNSGPTRACRWCSARSTSSETSACRIR